MRKNKFEIKNIPGIESLGLSEEQKKAIEDDMNEIEHAPIRLNIKFLDKKREYTDKELLEKKKRFIEKHGKNGKFFLGDGEGNG